MAGTIWTTNGTKSTKSRETRETQSARQTRSPMLAAFRGLRSPDCHTRKEAGNFTLPASAIASIFPWSNLLRNLVDPRLYPEAGIFLRLGRQEAGGDQAVVPA